MSRNASSGRLVAGVAIGAVLSLVLTFLHPHCRNFEEYMFLFVPIGGAVGTLSSLLGAAFGRYGWKSILLAVASALGVAMLVTVSMFLLSFLWVEHKEMSGLLCMLWGVAAGTLSMPPAFAANLLIIHRQLLADRAVVARIRSRRLKA
jgi:hypothetical protein